MYRNMASALVTGGAQGLGKGFARAILEQGGKVCVADFQEDRGKETNKEFAKEFGADRTLFVRCDVTDKQQLKHAYKMTKDAFGSIDLVVNNAGIATMVEDDWQRTIDVNLVAVMQSCFIAVDYMRSQSGGHGGHIINIASTAGLLPVPFDMAYSASKYGVVGVSRSMALMYRPDSIRVNCLCPSFADTEIVSKSLPLSPLMQMAVQDMGLMKVSDVVDAFRQLMSDPQLTGAVLSVTPTGTKFVFPAKRNQAKL